MYNTSASPFVILRRNLFETKMAGKQAKILTVEEILRLLSFVSTQRHPLQNRVIALLSIRAGLRAGEIAKLEWSMVLDPSCEIGPVIELRDHAAKKGSGRLIPVHPDLRDALGRWRETDGATSGVVRCALGGAVRAGARG